MPEALNIYRKAADFARMNLPEGHPVISNLEEALKSATRDAEKRKKRSTRRGKFKTNSKSAANFKKYPTEKLVTSDKNFEEDEPTQAENLSMDNEEVYETDVYAGEVIEEKESLNESETES